MSVTIIEKIQTAPFSDADASALIRAVMYCDTAADLPGVSDFTGYTLQQGSRAIVIDAAEEYLMQSDGTWSLQQGTDLQSIITALSDIDDRLNDTTADATWAKSQVENYIYPALISLINRGPKNALNLSAAQTTTDAGVTFTVNADFTVTCTGQATATAWLHVPVTVPAGRYYITGLPEDGGTDTFRQDFRPTPTGTPTTVNATKAPTLWAPTATYTGYFNIRVGSGFDFGAGKTFYPMLSQPDQYKVSDTYVPYAPTNRELYDLILSYHP